MPYLGMARPVSILELTAEEKAELSRRVRSSTTTQRDALRARIVLTRAEGQSEAEVAANTDVSLNTVSLWSKRFDSDGLDELSDAPAAGGSRRCPRARSTR